jgi:4-hydroxy-3-polyprenylbenzoate decarboxylase
LNAGSKVVMAAAGPPIRELASDASTVRLPDGFAAARRVLLPGVLVLSGPKYPGGAGDAGLAARFDSLLTDPTWAGFPLAVLVDDAEFAAANLNNWLWVTFTRSNPSADLHGIGAFVEQKHWGCRGSLIIDARTKPHHAPTLECDPQVARRIDALAARGGSLAAFL